MKQKQAHPRPKGTAGGGTTISPQYWNMKAVRRQPSKCLLNKWMKFTQPGLLLEPLQRDIRRGTGFRTKKIWVEIPVLLYIKYSWAVSKPFWFLFFSYVKMRKIKYFARLFCKGMYKSALWTMMWYINKRGDYTYISCILLPCTLL